MVRRLYRSTADRYIAGVCGGLGEYFQIDPAFVRILFVLLTFANGFGLLAYLIMWITVRKRPADAPAEAVEVRDSAVWSRYIPGVILIVLGILFFVHENVYWFDIEHVWEKFWPVVLIAIGLVLVLYRGNRKRQEVPNGFEQHQNGGVSA